MNYRISVSIALGVMLAAGTAWAHHNRSDIDMTKQVTLTGTLTKLDWRNPHIEFSLETKADNGQTESWSFEGGTPYSFASKKISKAVFEKAIGQTITVVVSTARDGSRYGTPWRITFPDGTVVVARGA